MREGNIEYNTKSIHGIILKAKFMYSALETMHDVAWLCGEVFIWYVTKTCVLRIKKETDDAAITITAVLLVINCFALKVKYNIL